MWSVESLSQEDAPSGLSSFWLAWAMLVNITFMCRSGVFEECLQSLVQTTGKSQLLRGGTRAAMALLVLQSLPLRVAKEVRKLLPMNNCVNVCNRQANAYK